MDTPVFKTLRIAPTTQQGGTQTIQQSIYLTHNNPCGANLLIFQEMGLTKIRYIDLKNYLDDIVGSDEMRALFEEIRIAATEYILAPDDGQKFYKYIYSIMNWAQQGISNLSVPVDYYPGYLFRVEVFDAAGIEIYDSYFPTLEVFRINSTTGLYELGTIPLVPSQIRPDSPTEGPLYKLTSVPRNIAFVNSVQSSIGLSTMLSNFLYNQSSMTETVMAVASLLIDSANTRTFGIPKYGFSARQNLSPFGGITYNCVNFIDIRTIPDEDGKTTLVESIFFRISLNEDTYNFSTPPPLSAPVVVPEEDDVSLLTELMTNEELMQKVVILLNRDLKNVKTNLQLIREGHEKTVLLKYYRKLYGLEEPEPISEEVAITEEPTQEEQVEEENTLLIEEEEQETV